MLSHVSVSTQILMATLPRTGVASMHVLPRGVGFTVPQATTVSLLFHSHHSTSVVHLIHWLISTSFASLTSTTTASTAPFHHSLTAPTSSFFTSLPTTSPTQSPRRSIPSIASSVSTSPITTYVARFRNSSRS